MRSELYASRAVRPKVGTHNLMIDVIYDETQKIGWTTSLVALYEHEADLDRGRFEHFRHEPQEWLASVRIEGTLTGDRLLEFREEVTTMVNWIAQHVDTPWSLAFREQGVNTAPTGTSKAVERSVVRYLDFTFADSHLGFAFKILFG